MIELAAAMDAEFKAADVSASTLTNKELRQKIAKKMQGGSISFQATLAKNPRFALRLKNWLRKERWWVGTLLFIFALSTFAMLGEFVVLYMVGAMLFVLTAGQYARTRCCLTVILAVGPWIAWVSIRLIEGYRV